MDIDKGWSPVRGHATSAPRTGGRAMPNDQMLFAKSCTSEYTSHAARLGPSFEICHTSMDADSCGARSFPRAVREPSDEGPGEHGRHSWLRFSNPNARNYASIITSFPFIDIILPNDPARKC